ncbi:LysE family translocator [Haloferula rosea]|uniref:LysE family translocator n=1 Tax=Haloferula rosea TaxID=490093 RepID=A0A934REV5_9BACT|nr:LysE family translocator [Haloferula rosea]MBK1827846.1 LysE family translocator [Haloferula rosea]
MVLDLLAFAGVMALGQFSPGPDMLLLTRTSLAEGARQGARMAAGIATGLSLHAAVAVGGAAILFDRSPWVRTTLSVLAAGYLLWLAWRLFMEVFVRWYSGAKEEKAELPAHGSAYRRGLLCNLLNPKVAVFLAAVTAPFLQGPRPGWWPAGLWTIIVVEGLVLWIGWAWVLQWRPVRGAYLKAQPVLDLVFALVLAALGVLMILGVRT